MYLPTRDIIATGLVAVVGLVYLLWAIGSVLPGMSSTRVTEVALLALGFAASRVPSPPASTSCSHGNTVYLVTTWLIGLAGVQMLITTSGAGHPA
jgi:hypothetical protein